MAFPPFFEPLLEVTFDHIDRCLSSTQEPLSFIIFLEITEYPGNSRSVDKLNKSKYKRKQFVLQPQTYELRSGVQFLFDPINCILKSNAHLLIVFLQNDAGFLKYGPTPERVELFLESLKIVEPVHPVQSPTADDQSTSPTAAASSSTAASAVPSASPAATTTVPNNGGASSSVASASAEIA